MRANQKRKTPSRSAKLRVGGHVASGLPSGEVRAKRAKRVVKQNAASPLFADVLERISDAFVALDTDWRYTYVNEKAAQIFGRRREDLLGKHIWTEFPEGIGQPFYQAYYKAVETQQPIYLEEYYPPYDRWFENRIFPSRNGLTIFFQDVTERKRLSDALEERNRRLLQSQRIARMSFLDWNTKTDRLLVSEDVYRLYGLARGTELTMTEFLAQVIHPGDLDAARQRLAEAARGGEPLDMDLRVLWPRGEIQWVHVQGELVPDPHGDPVTLLGTVVNITERRRADEAIIQSEKRFSQVFHASPVATSITSLMDGRYIDANEAWLRLFGYEKEELLGSTSLGLNIWVHPEERQGMIRQLEAAGAVRNFEHLARTKAGDVRDVLVSAEAIELNDERYNLSLVIDITERKRVEQALKASEKRLALIFDTASNVLFLIAVEGGDTFRFAAVNPAFLAVTGLVPEQVIGKRMQEVLPASAHALVLGKYRQAIQENKTVRWEEISVYPTGTLYGEVAISPAWDDAGNCTHLIGAVHDITEIRRAEERVRQLNVELEARVVERTGQLQLVNKELEAFSYSVSHDLRAPLRAISGFAEIVARRHRANLDEEGRHYVDNIVQASERMGRLIDDLLTFSRLGRQAVRHEPVPLRAVFDPLRRDRAAQLTDLHGTLEIADDLPVVIGDKTLLNQIFANLLDNAITYRRNQVPLRMSVTWQSQDRDVVIRVGDNGIGISSEYFEKIFNIFQRLHSEDEYPGTGIGLATVKKSVELLGGQVWVESVEHEGSTFSVRLPGSAS